VKVTRKCQVTIPLSVGRKLRIKVEDKLRVRVENGRIVMEPLFGQLEDPVEDMLSIFDRLVDVNAVRLVEESRNED